jgi:hypothetical protein
VIAGKPSAACRLPGERPHREATFLPNTHPLSCALSHENNTRVYIPG